MSVQQRVQRLEALLDRIRQRAATRGAASPAAAPPGPSLAFAAPIAVPPPVPAPAPAPAPEAVFTVSPVLPSPLEFVDQAPLEVLGEDDVIDEISSDMLESIPPSGGVTRVDVDVDEPPASSQRPKTLTLDEPSDALLEDEHDVLLKTPPPESGPQEAPQPTGLAAPLAPDVDLMTSDLMPLDASASELDAPFEPAQAAPAAAMPTVEQLGQTIDLEEPAGPSLELAAAAPTPAPPAHPATEDLEMALPVREVSGQYDAELLPPPEARDDLDAHRERAGDEPSAPEESSFAESGPVLIPELFPAPPADEITATIAVTPQGQGPEIVGRPPLESGTVFRIEPAALAPRPSTFIELLDASIALGD